MNKEGYKDPTAEQAIGNVDREINNRDISTIIATIKLLLSKTGLELVGRIHLRDKETGKEYR